MNKKSKVRFVVFYVDFPAMRERSFNTNRVASAFAATVSGSVAPFFPLK